MAKILLRDIAKKFGETIAVNNLNLEISDGEFVCLLGPSGSGKTTTLRLIAGLENPSSGEIYIGDRLVNDLSPRERDVAMVFQFPVIYPGLTVYDNMAFPLEQRGYKKKEVKDQVNKIAKRLAISNLLGEMASGLDADVRQRVALGRALVREPAALLLDEALTSLDLRTKLLMIAELKKLHEELNQTTVYVSHDQSEAMMMADRIALLESGNLQQYDMPGELYGNPKNLFVAGFIGSPPMNFIECNFDEKKGCVTALDFERYISDFREDVKEKIRSSELILGVRPEDISIHKASEKKHDLKGKVEMVQFGGDRLSLNILLDGRNINAISPRNVKVVEGEEVHLEFKRFHLFDRQTGKVISG